MAQYKVHEASYLPDGSLGISRMFQPGEVASVPDNLVPGPHMEPLDRAGKAAFLACIDRKTGKYVPPKMNKIEEMPLATFAGFDMQGMDAEGANG